MHIVIEAQEGYIFTLLSAGLSPLWPLVIEVKVTCSAIMHFLRYHDSIVKTKNGSLPFCFFLLQDCGLILSSEAEGRGCYPLDDHVLCKACNAARVQALTAPPMATEL